MYNLNIFPYQQRNFLKGIPKNIRGLLPQSGKNKRLSLICCIMGLQYLIFYIDTVMVLLAFMIWIHTEPRASPDLHWSL